MSEQRVDQAAEAATTGDADRGDSGQGVTRDTARATLDKESGDSPVPDAERRAQDTEDVPDEPPDTEGEDVLRTTAKRAGVDG